jgi:hypothetical protein
VFADVTLFRAGLCTPERIAFDTATEGMSPNELFGSVAAMAAGTRKEVKRERQQNQLHREIERWSAPGPSLFSAHTAVAGPLTTIVFVADATDTLAGLGNISAPETIEIGRQHQPHQQLNTAGSHERQSPLHLILCIWHNTLSIASACDWLPLSLLPVVICVADDGAYRWHGLLCS